MKKRMNKAAHLQPQAQLSAAGLSEKLGLPLELQLMQKRLASQLFKQRQRLQKAKTNKILSVFSEVRAFFDNDF